MSLPGFATLRGWSMVTGSGSYPGSDGSGCRSRGWRALNSSTVWTWNAIGKRKGAWTLSEDAPEATRGFLLNHLIPDRDPGGESSNSDPITGQAAWFDLRIRISKAEPEHDLDTAGLQNSVQGAPPGIGRKTDVLEYGKEWCG